MALLPPLIPLTDGQVAEASQVQANFNTIRNDYNGNITNANLSGSAGITDTNLATISTPNKVNATAFTDEGDWTASFTCGTSGTITLDNSYKTGHYIKIGKMVTVTGHFRVDSVSSPIGDLTLNGLPFATGNDYKFWTSVRLTANNLLATAVTSLMATIYNGTTQMLIHRYAAGSLSFTAGDVQATTNFTIGATYFTD